MRAMAIAGSQAVLAAGVVAFGIALLTGIGLGPQHVTATGSLRTLVGAVEIVTGVCLFLPRGHVIGTGLLAILTAALIGVLIGRSSGIEGLRLSSPKYLDAVSSFDQRTCPMGRGATRQSIAAPELAI